MTEQVETFQATNEVDLSDLSKSAPPPLEELIDQLPPQPVDDPIERRKLFAKIDLRKREFEVETKPLLKGNMNQLTNDQLKELINEIDNAIDSGDMSDTSGLLLEIGSSSIESLGSELGLKLSGPNISLSDAVKKNPKFNRLLKRVMLKYDWNIVSMPPEYQLAGLVLFTSYGIHACNSKTHPNVANNVQINPNAAGN